MKGEGRRGLRKAGDSDDRVLVARGCPWCPIAELGAAAPPATHVGLIDGRVVLFGCAWHMRLFVARGELRALGPRQKRSRRRA